VEVTRRAARDLDRLRRAQPVLFEKLVAKIRALARNPKGGKALVGPLKGIWSLRVGDYRILYELARGTVIVLTINHRREVYK
jgi:mRNA interferase RelE/StbE